MWWRGAQRCAGSSHSKSGKSRTQRKRHSRSLPFDQRLAELRAQRAQRLERRLPRAGGRRGPGRPPSPRRRASSSSQQRAREEPPRRLRALRRQHLHERQARGPARPSRSPRARRSCAARDRARRRAATSATPVPPAACAGFAHDVARRARQQRGHVVQLEAEAQVGLVGAVAVHRLAVGEPRERRRQRRRRARPSTARANSPSTTAKTSLLAHERHLDVDLRVLGLAVGAQVLVAQAARELEVAVDAARPSGSACRAAATAAARRTCPGARGSARRSRARPRASA